MVKKNSTVLLFRYTVVPFLIVGVFFSFSLTAYAQFGQLGSGTLNSSVNLTGVGAIALDCVSSNTVSSPFGQAVGGTAGGALGGAIGSEVGGETGQTIGTLLGTVGGGLLGGSLGGGGVDPVSSPETAVASFQSVPVKDAAVGQNTGLIQTNTKVIEGEEKRENKKEECLDRIAQWAAITVMDRITLATLNWINSGFEGKPFFLENPEQFFSDLATKELLGFSATFSGNPEVYPFGETIVRTILVSFQRTFQQNMVNSLNNVLAHGTRAEWEQNFSVGGWAAYTAYVEPNNNIFGAYIESTRNINRNLVGTRNSVAVNIQAELQQGLGFLSQKACAETQDGGTYIPENSVQHTKVPVPNITEVNQIPTSVYTYITACEADDVFDENGDGDPDSDGLCESFDEDIIAVAEDFRGRSICVRWKTNTPGNQISEALTRSVGNSQDQLLLVDEFNENLGLLLDAFMLQLINEGVSFFNKDNPDNVLEQQVNGENPGAQENSVPFIEAVNGFGEGNSSFLGVIPLQEEYIEKTTTLIGLYAEVFQRTLDLDYCVPGPNPNWQNLSSQAIADLMTTLPAYESLPQEIWPQSTPAGFGGLAGDISGLGPAEGDEIYQFINYIYSSVIHFFTGVSFDPEDLSPEITNRETQLLPILYGTFSDYATLINQRFILADDFDQNLRGEAYDYFFNLDEIQDIVVQYETSLQIASQNLEQLIELREEYAQIEHGYIIEQLQIAVNEQGISSLSDNLATFQSFSGNEITYIGSNGQNSAYHNAVIALTDEIGESVTPPTSYDDYGNILEDFVDLIPNTASQDNLESVEDEITIALESIGNPGDDNSLIGLTYSCIQQINEIGPYQNIPFTGFTERKPYPLPLSEDIPGLLSLPVTETFAEDITVSTSNSDITIGLLPLSAIDEANNLQIFESNFINTGQSLY